MKNWLNKELLLAKQSELLIIYKELENIVSIPVDLSSSEGQSWVRAISYRIVQEMVEAYEGNPNEPVVPELIDCLFYYLELILLTDLQADMLEWEEDIDYTEKIESRVGWNDVFWGTTVEIGRLNHLLRKREWREEGSDLDTEIFSAYMRRIWNCLVRFFSLLKIHPKEIERLYLEKWEINLNRAMISRQEKTTSNLITPLRRSSNSEEKERKLQKFP